MFAKDTYTKRRNSLIDQVDSGVILFPGNMESPMNYPANAYHFRQDSNFLYFFGIDKPGFFGMIDVDEGTDYLFADDFTLDDIIWMGPQPTVKALARKIGVKNTATSAELGEKIESVIKQNRKIHFLPAYRGETKIQMAELLGISLLSIKNYASEELIKGVVDLRSVKSEEELSEIERALEISSEIYSVVMQMAQSGVFESEIAGEIKGVVGSHDAHISFPIILSVHGETLHNHSHKNRLKKGDLLVADTGAESPEFYASDITRTFPVGGKFTPEQKAIYEIVLKANTHCIKSIKPGKSFKNIHLQAAKIIAQGLKDLGLMKGDIDSAVKNGAHALFFPHGLGHMMGLDVHDMEGLGENYVGYDDRVSRSSQFGLAYLRLARELRPGFVLTVEPGIYFIPSLIDKWQAENKFTEFINYSKVQKFRTFGGIRIEDDIAVTENSYKVLGAPIPKSVKDIENIMG